MNLKDHLIHHLVMGVHGAGRNVYSVGDFGGFPTIESAVAAAGNPITKRYGQTATMTATAGSAVLVGTGTTWTAKDANGAANIFCNDLWKPDLGARYYRVKTIDSDTQITLWEPVAAVDAFTGVVNHSFYWLNRKTIFVLPGHHTCDYVSLKPGIDFSGASPYSTFITESQGVNPYPFYLVSDNVFHNIGVRPNNRWGDMDAFGICDPNAWGGAHCVIDSCLIDNRNTGNSHAGGSLTLPLLRGGLVEVVNSEIINARSATIGPVSGSPGGIVTPTLANTIFRMEGTRIKILPDYNTADGTTIDPSGMVITATAAIGTFEFFNSSVSCRDNGLNTQGTKSVAGFKVTANSAAACVLNIRQCDVDVSNTEPGGNATLGIANNGATVNIEMTSVRVSGSAATAVNHGNASSVTVITNSMINGTTALNNAAAGSLTANARNNHITGVQTGIIS